MAYQYRLIDGVKAINLEDFPPEAWRLISGQSEDTAELDKLYKAVSFLYRAIDIRANAVAGLPWAVQRLAGEEDVWTSEDPDNPPGDLEPLTALPDLLWQTEAELCLTSQAFWLKNMARNGKKLLEVRWLQASSVTPKWDANTGLIAFERRLTGGERISLEVDDVVWVWLRGRDETKPRTPPAQAGLRAAGVIYNADQFISQFFERGAIKATLLTVEGTPSEPERARLKAWWGRFIQGIRSAFTAEVVSAAVKPVIVGEGVAELGNAELTSEKREDIATAIGVPHSLVLSNAANFATSQQDTQNFYDLTIVPEAKLIQRQLNRQLFAPLGYTFEFRPNELSLYQEDEQQRAQAFSLYVNGGMKPSIAAQILGVDLPEGVEYEDLDPEPMPAQLAAAQEQPPDDQDGSQSLPPQDEERVAEVRRFRTWAKRRASPDPAQFKSDILSNADKAALLTEAATAQPPFDATELHWTGALTLDQYKAMRLQLDPDDDEAEQRIRDSLERRSERELAAALGDVLAAATPDNDGDVPQMPDAADRELRQGRRVRDVLERMLLEAADLGVNAAVVQLEGVGFGFDWTLANVAARDWADARAGQLITQISDTTRRTVQQAVSRWAQNGESLDALVRDLAPIFGRQRAALIAATEVTQAYYRGNLEGWRASGVVQQIEWRTARDELVCPTCGPLHGQRTALGESWHDGIEPPAHPNCRCWAAPVVA